MPLAVPRKQKLHLLFSFGAHENKADFENVVKLFTRFKPHIYAPENGDLRLYERPKFAKWENNNYAKAAKDPFFKRQLIDRERPKDRDGFLGRAQNLTSEFRIAEMEFLIDSRPRPIVYPIEGTLDDSPKKLMQSFGRKLGEAHQYFARMEFDRAYEVLLAAYKDLVASLQIRNDAMIQSLPNILNEARAQFPKLACLDTVKVLARLGTHHIDVYYMATGLAKTDTNLIVEHSKDPDRFIKPYMDELIIAIKAKTRITNELLHKVLVEPPAEKG